MTQAGLAMIAVMVLAISAVAIAIWAFRRWRGSADRDLHRVLRTMSSDMLVDFVIPDGVGGEIHIDHLLLTPHGLILLETKDMQGAVFAGDRMDTWSATYRGERLTFNNPISMLQERAAAITRMAPGVPIESRVLFTNEATFPKGHPPAVATVSGLIEEYRSVELRDERHDFSAQWEMIESAAASN